MRSTLDVMTLAVALLVLPAQGMAAGPAQRSVASADAVLADASKATWIADGGGAGVIYVFFDPNCPSCQLLYRNLRIFVASHEVQVRWIPVAVVNATSLGKAAAILQAPNRLEALRHNEEHYRGETYSGGIDEEIPSSDAERQLRANEALLNRLDIPVVPTMLFASKDGRTVIIQGTLSPLALRKVFARLP